MPAVRKDVLSLGGKWNDTLLWYAKAVRALQDRPITDPASWWFLGAIHGFHPVVWKEFNFITDTTPLPADPIQAKFWGQCQHQSWYFLPWHRGYLYAFEEIVRDAIVAMGGPADWALPYWNYSRPDDGARILPEEFSDEALPDGSANPLYVERRFGGGTLPIEIDEPSVSLRSLEDTIFTGGDSDVPPGFGGPETTFHHGPESETTNGSLESLPHNNVHGAVGGARPGTDPNQWWNLGLMSMPITAGLDPIFWLHHSNIDRLWTIWAKMEGRPTPAETSWLDGPDDRPFEMPLSGGRTWRFSARHVLDTGAAPLDYHYEDESPPAVPARGTRRLEALGVRAVSPSGARLVEEMEVAPGNTPELIGASDGEVEVAGRTTANVRMDGTGVGTLRSSLSLAATGGAPAREPPRTFLKVEGIRGTADAAVYHVYIDLPRNADPADYRDRLAGTISLFGISAATDRDGPSAGSGVNQVMEITEIVDALHLSGDDLSNLNVQLVPSNAVAAASTFSIRRISVFKLGD